MDSWNPGLEALDVGIATFLAATLILSAWTVSAVLPVSERRRQRAGSIGYLCLVVGLSGVAAANGFLRDFSSRPPRLLLLMVILTANTLAVALSSLGRRLASQIPLWGLVGFQSFRILVEILLWGLHRAGSLPVQMTFEGYNFDVLTGLSAIGVAWAIRARRMPTWGVRVWNLCGLALLLNVVIIAVLSMPTPFRAFLHGPPNAVVAQLPFVWIPCVMVQAALLGHILVFRSLRMGGAGALEHSDQPGPARGRGGETGKDRPDPRNAQVPDEQG
jgi:hypothetical protein